MTQQVVYTDKKENRKVERLSKKWEINKAETIKKMIREFKEDGHQK